MREASRACSVLIGPEREWFGGRWPRRRRIVRISLKQIGRSRRRRQSRTIQLAGRTTWSRAGSSTRPQRALIGMRPRPSVCPSVLSYPRRLLNCAWLVCCFCRHCKSEIVQVNDWVDLGQSSLITHKTVKRSRKEMYLYFCTNTNITTFFIGRRFDIVRLLMNLNCLQFKVRNLELLLF